MAPKCACDDTHLYRSERLGIVSPQRRDHEMSDQDPTSKRQRQGKPDLPGNRFAFTRMVAEVLDQQVAFGDPVAVELTLRTLERLEKTPENERTPRMRQQ